MSYAFSSAFSADFYILVEVEPPVDPPVTPPVTPPIQTPIQLLRQQGGLICRNSDGILVSVTSIYIKGAYVAAITVCDESEKILSFGVQ